MLTAVGGRLGKYFLQSPHPNYPLDPPNFLLTLHIIHFLTFIFYSLFYLPGFSRLAIVYSLAV